MPLYTHARLAGSKSYCRSAAVPKVIVGNLDGVLQLLVKGEPIPHFDVHCPIMSLPLAFKTTLETIPAKIPYLAVSQTKSEKWRAKLTGTALKVGVVWAGNPNHVQDLDRSIPLENICQFSVLKAQTILAFRKNFVMATGIIGFQFSDNARRPRNK